MLCTFLLTRDSDDRPQPRTLIVRSEDIKRLVDVADGTSELTYHMGLDTHTALVVGTAAENRDRVQQEELDGYSRVSAHQQQLQQRVTQGLPAIPVPRGRQPSR